MILYSLRTLLADERYMLAKFDEDFNVAATYNLTRKGFGFTCDCPAGHRNKVKPCKHQRSMPKMLPNADTDKFYCMDTMTWHEPLADPGVDMPRIETSNCPFCGAQAGSEHDSQCGRHPLQSGALEILKEITLPEGTEPSEVAEAFGNLNHAGEGPVPSPLAANTASSPSKDESPSDRGQPAPTFKRRF